MSEIKGYFMESEIWFQGKKQPPRKTPIVGIAGDLDSYSNEDEIQVLSLEGDWYHVKKKDIILTN